MAIELTWLGHATWRLRSGGHTLLVDPFLDDSPTAPLKAAAVQADFILVSHGHYDHVADAAAIARRCRAKVISNFEICQWLVKQGVPEEQTHPHNLGGGSRQPFGHVQLAIAFHSSALPDGANGGNPSGFLLTLEGKRVYLACDTGLFGDMRLIGETGLDLAVLPIGDQFTMGPDDALRAVRLLAPRRVVPSHYNTWPPIAQDAHAWADRVRRETSSAADVLAPGESLTL